MKAIKITNPVWLGEIAPKINDFAKTLDAVGMDYVSIYSYFRNIVQFGGDRAELWVVMDNGKPVAFATWAVKNLPYVSSASLDNIYKWVKNHEPVELLMKEFLNFGLRHRCVNYFGYCINKYVKRLLSRECNKVGYTFNETGVVECIMKKEEQDG